MRRTTGTETEILRTAVEKDVEKTTYLNDWSNAVSLKASMLF
jgi:hypothetical protein